MAILYGVASLSTSERKLRIQIGTCPPQHKGLNAFEADLYELARSIQFKKVHNSFLSSSSQDVKLIVDCTSLLVPADKTTNPYKVGITDYKKLLHDNVTANYQITDANNRKV